MSLQATAVGRVERLDVGAETARVLEESALPQDRGPVGATAGASTVMDALSSKLPAGRPVEQKSPDLAEAVRELLLKNSGGIVIGDTNHADAAIHDAIKDKILPEIRRLFPDKTVVLCVEWPKSQQKVLDEYLKTGDVSILEEAFKDNAWDNPGRIRLMQAVREAGGTIKAVDSETEQPPSIFDAMVKAGPPGKDEDAIAAMTRVKKIHAEMLRPWREQRMQTSNPVMIEEIKKQLSADTVVIAPIGDAHIDAANDVNEGTGLPYLRLVSSANNIADRAAFGRGGADVEYDLAGKDAARSIEEHRRRLEAGIKDGTITALSFAEELWQKEAAGELLTDRELGRKLNDPLVRLAAALAENDAAGCRTQFARVMAVIADLPEERRENTVDIAILKMTLAEIEKAFPK